MTFSEEYQRMRPLEDERETPTVWGNMHRRVFDPIPFLLRQAGKASHWVAAEQRFFKGPGSGKKKKSARSGWPDLSYEQGVCNKAWCEARHQRDVEMIPLNFIPWELDNPPGITGWLLKVWEARTR